MNEFSHFIKQIPREIMKNVETYAGNQIILFKPNTFVTKVTVESIDYHFSLLSSDSPPMLVDNKKISIGKNRLMAINPGTSMHCMEERPTPGYYSLSIKSEFVEKIAREMGHSGEIRFSNISNPCSSYLKQAVHNIEWGIRNFPNNCSLIHESTAIQVTAAILSEVQSNINKVPRPYGDGKHFVDTAMDYINTFFYTNIKLEDICKEIYITPYHFIRSFKDRTGMTPHEYLLNVRIARAKDLLKNGQYSITDAAKMCGFISVSHFSHVFRKSTGESPSEYRKSYFIY